MNCYAPLLQKKEKGGAGGDRYPNQENCATTELALAGTEFWDVSAWLVWKTEHHLQIRTSWKIRSKTDPAMERENLKLPQTGFVSLALD